MNKKYATLILIGILSGLLSPVLVSLLQYIYLEITVTDPYVSQYNGFVFLSVLFYTPFTFVAGILLALGLQKTKVKALGRKKLFLVIVGICSAAILIYMQIQRNIILNNSSNQVDDKVIILDYDQAQRNIK